MQITAFGVVWTLFLIVAFFQNNVRGIIWMTLFSMVLQCNNVAVIGSTAIGVQVFTVLIALIRLFLLPLQKGKTIKRFSTLFVAPLIFFAYLIINSILIPGPIGQNGIKIMIIGIYSVFAFLLYSKRLSVGIDELWLEKVVDRIVVFVLLVGAVQYLTCSGISLFRPLLTTCIYNDTANTDVIFHSKPGYQAIYSTFMEPSYFAGFMVGMFAMISMRKNVSLKNICLLSAIALEVLLSRSATGYGALAIVFAILVFRFYGKKRIVRFILPLAIIGVFCVVLFNYELLDKVLFSKSETSSYAVRTRWNIMAWTRFCESPILGVGVGESRASSLFYTVLAETGIIGFILYMRIIFKSTLIALKGNYTIGVTGVAFAVFSIWICQIIACPDINFAPMWLMLFLLAIYCNLNVNKSLEISNGVEK